MLKTHLAWHFYGIYLYVIVRAQVNIIGASCWKHYIVSDTGDLLTIQQGQGLTGSLLCICRAPVVGIKPISRVAGIEGDVL